MSVDIAGVRESGIKMEYKELSANTAVFFHFEAYQCPMAFLWYSGAETVVDIWLHAGEEEPETSDEPVTVKTEVESPVVEEVPASASVVPTPDHDYIANPAPVAATRLTTLVKCMDKNGHVIYLTLGKPQVINIISQQSHGNLTETF